MPIITVSRGSFSGGKMLAEAVAQKLAYRCIDRNEIVQKAAAWGVSEEDIRTALEKPPSFLGQSPQAKYIYLAFVQAALAHEVRSGKAVYHGLAGHLLLGSGSHLLRTRIVAPMEYRIEQVQNRLKVSRKDAITYIEKIDQDRRKWTKYLYDLDWADPSHYDLVLNLEQMSLHEACDVICSVAQSPSFEFTAEVRRAIDNIALASLVKANLARDTILAEFQFTVTADHGSVTVKGGIDHPEQAKRLAKIVHGVPGVTKLDLDEVELVARI